MTTIRSGFLLAPIDLEWPWMLDSWFILKCT